MATYITSPAYFMPHMDILNAILNPRVIGHNNPKICDVGCGFGQITYLFDAIAKHNGLSPTSIGIDSSEYRISFANSLKNPTALAKELEEVKFDEFKYAGFDWPYISDWIDELNAGGYDFDSIKFLEKSIGRDSTPELGDVDVLIFNGVLEYMLPEEHEYVLSNWTEKGPIIINSCYPELSRAQLSDAYGDDLTFLVFEKANFPRIISEEVGEIMIAFPKKRFKYLFDESGLSNDNVFNLFDMPSRDSVVFEVTEYDGVASSKCYTDEYDYYYRPSFYIDLPICMRKRVTSGVGRGYVASRFDDNEDEYGTYCLRVETDDVLPDQIASSKDRDLKVEFVSKESGNYYDISAYGNMDSLRNLVLSKAKELYRKKSGIPIHALELKE